MIEKGNIIYGHSHAPFRFTTKSEPPVFNHCWNVAGRIMFVIN